MLRTWLGTAAMAGLAGVLLLLGAHGKPGSLLGAAAVLDLTAAAAAAGYGLRRAAQVRARTASMDQPRLPAVLLVVTAVIVATALMVAVAVLTAR